MKKQELKILISILFIFIAIISAITVKKERVTNDEKQFKKEYEKFNGKTNDNTGKKYIDLNIDLKNGIKYIDSKQTIDILKNKTGIIYFGFPQCPWCRNMIEVLLEAKEQLKVDTIYYYNALEIRDEKVLENNEVKTEKKGTKDYYKILKLLGNKADTYEGLNDESIKRLYFPTVVFVKNGRIVDTHMSTLDSQKDPYKKLNKKQRRELKKIYIENIKKINGIICSSDIAC